MTNKPCLMSTAFAPQSVMSDAIRFSNVIVWSGLVLAATKKYGCAVS
jgi:hypothetical protein